MIYTNEYGIPDAIVDAVRADPYDKGDADFSATGLLKPQQIIRLWNEHADRISVDVRDEVWRLLGQGVHSVLDRAGEEHGTTEERFFAEIGGKTISGQIDLQDGKNANKITDYKVTSTYSYQLGLKADWEQQINIYAWLRQRNGHETDEAEIVVILRDWMKSRAGQDKYPNSPIQTIPVPLWLPEVTEEFIQSRIDVHTQEEVAPCTDEDRWARGAWKWKPEKGRSKSFNTLATATLAMQEKGGAITSQEPTYVRCEGDWCGVAKFCPQWAAQNKSTTDGEIT